MKDNKPENPLAFPFYNPDYKAPYDMPMYVNGMTLRDYFAAKAEINWNVVMNTLNLQGIKDSDITLEMVAELRAKYKFLEADAMLKARETNH